MIKQLAITDLTRMYRGCVCIAGYDREGQCFRPILPPPGINESSLFVNHQPIIFPFAVVEFHFKAARPQPPHTEDFEYDPTSIKFIRSVKIENRERLLGFSLFAGVETIFEQTVHDDFGYYVMDGCGPRSTGTILPDCIQQVLYERDIKGAWDYRIKFIDQLGRNYRLKITDLTWHYYCDSQRDDDHPPERIAARLADMLKHRKVYLRIGLSRGWAKFPERCFLQVNAIHTFPDYLEGRTFADYSPNREPQNIPF